MEAYPDAKVILTVRDVDKWYDSTLNTIFQASKFHKSFPFNFLSYLSSFAYYNGRMHKKNSTKPFVQLLIMGY